LCSKGGDCVSWGLTKESFGSIYISYSEPPKGVESVNNAADAARASAALLFIGLVLLAFLSLELLYEIS